MKQECLFCGKIFHGRTSRKFCSQTCSNRYHSEQRKHKEISEDETTITTKIRTLDKQRLLEFGVSVKDAIHEGTLVYDSRNRKKQLLKENIGFIMVMFMGLICLAMTPFLLYLLHQLLFLFLGIFLSVYGLLNGFFYESFQKFCLFLSRFICKDT